MLKINVNEQFNELKIYITWQLNRLKFTSTANYTGKKQDCLLFIIIQGDLDGRSSLLVYAIARLFSIT